MASKLTRKEFHDVCEYYAYRTSTKCVKLEELILLIGGNYDWNPRTDFKTALWTHQKFFIFNKKVRRQQGIHEKNVKMHYFEQNEENIKFMKHIFCASCTNEKRKHVCVHAAICLKFNFGVGVFTMPCKF